MAGDDCAVAELRLEREDAYGVIKAAASWFERFSMRMGRLFGLFLTILGLIRYSTSLSAAVLHYDLRTGSGVVEAIRIPFRRLCYSSQVDNL